MESKDFTLVCDILFYEKKRLAHPILIRYPIENTIRLSCWLENSTGSTSSEIRIGETIHPGQYYEVEVVVAGQASFSSNMVEPNTKVYFGTFPHPFGEGIIKEVTVIVR
jgi:hypothetical protein